MYKNRHCIWLLLIMLFLSLFVCGCNKDKGMFLDALATNDWNAAQSILNRHPELVHMHVKSGGTLLHAAVYYDNKEALSFLIKNGANVNARSCEDNSSPLHYAAILRRYEMASLLLKHGVDVNCRDESLDTPLHDAAMYSTKKMVELLISHGAEVEAKNELGRTPLYYACVYRDDNDDAVEVVKTLLENGADPNDKCSTDSSIIQIILVYPDYYFKKAQVLEDYGAKLEVNTKEGTKIMSVKEFQQLYQENREYLQKMYEQNKQEWIK